MLETILNGSLTDYCTLEPDCFEIPTEGTGDVYLDWSKVESKSLEIARLQVKKDTVIFFVIFVQIPQFSSNTISAFIIFSPLITETPKNISAIV